MTAIINQNPAAGSASAGVATNVEFTIEDQSDDSLVSVQLVINGDPAVDVITGGVFDTGYNGTITPNGGDLDVVINPDVDFGNSDHVEVDVDVAYDNTDALMLSIGRYVRVDPINVISTQANFTVRFWLKVDSHLNNFPIMQAMSAFDTVASNLNISISANALRITLRDASSFVVHTWTSAAGVLVDNTWTHFTITFQSGVGLSVRRNDVALPSLTVTGAVPTSILTFPRLAFGHSSSGTGTNFTYRDEVAIWNSVLGSSSLTELYSGGATTEDLLDGTHLYASPDYYARFNGDLVDATGGSGTGSFQGSGGTLGVDYGFNSTIIPGGPFSDSYEFDIGAITQLIEADLTASAAIDADIIAIYPLVVGATPNFDTYRGGKQILLYSQNDLSTIETSFLVQSVPSGWAETTCRQSVQGCQVLQGGELASTDTFLCGRMTLRVKLLSGETEFFFLIDGSNYFEIHSTRVDNSTLFTSQISSATGFKTCGGLLVEDENEFDLTVVRYQNFLAAFVDDQKIYETTRFLNSGSMSVQIEEGEVEGECLVKAFTIQSAALIDNKLVEDTVPVGLNRMTGRVPASSYPRIGTRDLIAFGPWGYAIGVDEFRYDVPKGLTLGGQPRARIYADTSVKD